MSPFESVPAGECDCDVDYLCPAHQTLLDQEADYWAPKLEAAVRACVTCLSCGATVPYINTDGFCDDCAIDVRMSDEEQLESLR